MAAGGLVCGHEGRRRLFAGAWLQVGWLLAGRAGSKGPPPHWSVKTLRLPLWLLLLQLGLLLHLRLMAPSLACRRAAAAIHAVVDDTSTGSVDPSSDGGCNVLTCSTDRG